MSSEPKIAICAIVRDEAPYIREWIAFHLLQGVSEILIYDDGSIDGTIDLIERAGRRAEVSVVDWSGRGDHFDSVQRAAYKEGAFRLSGRADFVAFIDADEFLHSRNGRLLPSELASVPGTASAVAVGMRLFGSSGLATFSPDFVTSRFTKCTTAHHPGNAWFKTIARPNEVEEFDSVHSIILRSGEYVLNDYQGFSRSSGHPGRADRIGTGALQLNHYMLKSLEEYRQKQARGHRRGMAERYDDGYFFCRDSDHWANAVECNELTRIAPSISKMIAELWTS